MKRPPWLLVLLVLPLGGCDCASSTMGAFDADTLTDALVGDAAGDAARDATASSDGLPSADAATCAADQGGCDVHATCDDSSGSIVCACLPGYAGDGRTCLAVATELGGLRWELPCEAPLTDPFCETLDLPVVTTTTLTGDPGITYDLELRFRGIVESKAYDGGVADGLWYVGGTPPGDPYNVYKLDISDPPQTYYLNYDGLLNAYCFVVDYTRTVQATGNAVLTLTADPIDGEQVENVDVGGAPIVIPGVPPAPEAYDGQFVQVDVLSVTTAP